MCTDLSVSHVDVCITGAGPLVTISVEPWNYKDKIIILGDAAHACKSHFPPPERESLYLIIIYLEVFPSMAKE